VTRVGCIEAAAGLRLTDGHGAPLDLQLAGFDHFT
jgi:thiamine-monophosphate kinase